MNHWAFVLAAYGVTLFGAVGLVIGSVASMRRAERRAERIAGRRT